MAKLNHGRVPDTSATCFQKPVFRAWLARRLLWCMEAVERGAALVS
jgi:hypothetical protein